MRLAFAVSVVLLADCTGGGGYSSATGATGSNGHPKVTTSASSGTTAGGSTQGTGTSGGSQGSAGSTTGGVASCTQDPSACPPNGMLTLDACPEGQVEVAGNLADYCHTEQSFWCAFTCSDIYTSSLETSGDGCGYFHFCVPPNTPLHMTIASPGYLTLDFATISAPVSTELASDPGIPMVCDGIYALLGLEDFNPALPSLLTNVYSVVGQQGPSACKAANGWSFALQLPDGGGPVASTVAYQSGTSFSTTDTITSTEGFVLFYNIDPTITSVRLSGTNPSVALSDGGTLCPNIPGVAPFYFTGEVVLEQNKASYMPYLIPAP